WLLIIAPPSSAKTEIISSLNGIPDIYPLSSLTAHTLVSGMIDEEDKSLLLKLTGKIVALKDFTSVISMHREQRAEVLSQLREIYDGSYKKPFGTGQVTEWEGKIGFIAGVTPIIDTHYAIFQMLGERFIQFRIKSPDHIKMALKGMENSGREPEIRKELRNAVSSFIASVSLPNKKIILPTPIKEKIAPLAAFCVKARSGSVRDGRSREIIYTPEPEAPPRLAKQFVKLGEGLAVINGRFALTEDDYRIIYRVATDTIPKQRKDIIYKLSNSPLSTNAIKESIKYPTSTVRKIFEELRSLGLVDISDQKIWSLTALTEDLLSKIEPFPEVSTV
ncbi:MAG: hypothetical protein P9X22_07175, partial [Candidatus Zapsychrus exili]|nr:hypothetical protein [Candidatus Zapsychrus exili]